MIVVDLVLTCQEGIGNLTFGNWYTSYKLISMLTAMNIPTIYTVHGDHIDSAPITSKSQMARIPHGNYCYAYNDSVGLYYICWAIVWLLCCQIELALGLLKKGESLSRKD